MKLIQELKRTYLYLSGQSQWEPMWISSLPNFFLPIYTDRERIRWFGFNINTESALPGETLMMMWRRRLIVWKEDR